MKNLARIRWVVFAVVSGASAGAGIVAGCASDDTVVGPKPDASVDGGPKPDTGVDAGSDTGRDTGVDAGDSATNFDVGPPQLGTYVAQITRLYCLKMAHCCTVDEKAFNLAQCEYDYGTEFSTGPGLNVPFRPYLDGGNIELNEAKAQQCFDDINRLLHCGAVAPKDFRTVHADCLAGATGTIDAGATGCTGSPECDPTYHCEKPDGGGPGSGTCVPARATNAECDLGYYNYDGTERGGNPYEPTAQCGYLLTGDPGYCANADTQQGYTTGTSKCRPPEPNGARCYLNVECQSRFCSDFQCDDAGNCPGTCRTQDLIGPDNLCNFYKLKTDAGLAPQSASANENAPLSPSEPAARPQKRANILR